MERIVKSACSGADITNLLEPPIPVTVLKKEDGRSIINCPKLEDGFCRANRLAETLKCVRIR